VPNKIPIVIPNWYKKYKRTSNVLGVSSVNLLIPVIISKRELKKKTNNFSIPCMLVNLSNTKVITVTDMAITVRKPVFIPKIRNSIEITSVGLVADKFESSIFSGEAKRGTLKIAFIKNIVNKEIDTVLT
jgi:hypothetical protein